MLPPGLAYAIRMVPTTSEAGVAGSGCHNTGQWHTVICHSPQRFLPPHGEGCLVSRLHPHRQQDNSSFIDKVILWGCSWLGSFLSAWWGCKGEMLLQKESTPQQHPEVRRVFQGATFRPRSTSSAQQASLESSRQRPTLLRLPCVSCSI